LKETTRFNQARAFLCEREGSVLRSLREDHKLRLYYTTGAVRSQAAEPEPPAPPFHVNRTTADTLTYLPGVGAVLAGRIVAERERGGPFRGAADLRRVKGIGPKLTERLGPLLLYDTGPPFPPSGASGPGPAGR
ncbi:helix-hairpin-helix domain-containing protein, partial [bacterium]|nr:helix-hairpin-helix domain-containing protein [bacterium]